MSKSCRVIQGGICEVTQGYAKGRHDGIDLVNKGYTLGNIVAHSDGTVVDVVSNCNENTNGENGHRLSYIYGNYVKIKHDDGYYTLYAHGAYNTVKVKKGDKVSKGQVLFYMGNTGYSFGGHVHFEVRNASDVKIDPTGYINAELPKSTPEPTPSGLKHKVGDVVSINGVYVSSLDSIKLPPAITKGTITRIVEGARNPYLLNNGNIGWVNDSCIVNGSSKSVDELAKEVIRGDWGNGQDRINRLTKAGYNYREIQDRVNAMLR